MSSSIVNNRRIAKNTLLLYARMLLMMGISLFTSRITLAALGITDYGIYNVVGGMVAMFSILSGSLSLSISRYTTMEVGKGNIEKLKTIFSTSVSIQLFMALLVGILAEVAGVWFLNHKMVIPSDRLYAAHWVLHFSILTFMIGLISVPYNALIIAHEKMSAFAYVSILDASLKLLIVYLLYISPVDKLIVYAGLLACVSIVIRIVYGIYCKRHFVEAHYDFRLNKQLLRDMFGFIGWTFWGNGVVVLKDQGTNILLNMFCGPAVNAARGVAMQVNGAIYGFVQNFMVAVNPQITKSYSVGNLPDMHKLIIRSTKFAFFILLLLLIPVCANIDYILNLWLVEVPEHTASFVILILLYSLMDCFANPLITGVLAQGDIKPYEIALTFIYLINFFASYVCLKAGMVVETVFVLNIIFKACVVFALLLQSRSKYAFPISQFFQKCLMPSLTVFLLSTLFVSILPGRENPTFAIFVGRALAIVIFIGILSYTIGMTKNEKKYMWNMFIEKVYKRVKR